MAAETGHNYQSLSESVLEKPAKPALGPPHDTRATVLITGALGAVLLFQGHVNVVGGWTGWAGWLAAFAVLACGIYYFQRAYGFASRGWGHAPMGAVMAAVFGFMVTGSFVAPAVYRYSEESALGLVFGFLAIAMLATGILRAALGPARSRQTPSS